MQNDDGDILLIFRRGIWDMPKGKLDKGETIEQCAVREVGEETGLQNIELGAFIFTTYHEYFDKWTKRDLLKETHWYAMRVYGSTTLIPQTEEDIEEIRWVKKQELDHYLSNMHKNIIQVIEKYLSASRL